MVPSVSLREDFMRGNPVGGSLVVVLMLMTGCPTEFGKDGRVNDAVSEDALRLVRKRCTDDEVTKYCGGGRQNTPECIRQCG